MRLDVVKVTVCLATWITIRTRITVAFAGHGNVLYSVQLCSLYIRESEFWVLASPAIWWLFVELKRWVCSVCCVKFPDDLWSPAKLGRSFESCV